MTPFLWMEFNCLGPTEQLRVDNLLLTTTSPRIPAINLIDIGRIKG